MASYLLNLQVSNLTYRSLSHWLAATEGVYLSCQESYSSALVRSAHYHQGAVTRQAGLLHFLMEAISFLPQQSRGTERVGGWNSRPTCNLESWASVIGSSLTLQYGNMLLSGGGFETRDCALCVGSLECAALPPVQLPTDTILLLLCSSQPLCTEPQMPVKWSQKKYLG